MNFYLPILFTFFLINILIFFCFCVCPFVCRFLELAHHRKQLHWYPVCSSIRRVRELPHYKLALIRSLMSWGKAIRHCRMDVNFHHYLILLNKVRHFLFASLLVFYKKKPCFFTELAIQPSLNSSLLSRSPNDASSAATNQIGGQSSSAGQGSGNNGGSSTGDQPQQQQPNSSGNNGGSGNSADPSSGNSGTTNAVDASQQNKSDDTSSSNQQQGQGAISQG